MSTKMLCLVFISAVLIQGLQGQGNIENNQVDHYRTKRSAGSSHPCYRECKVGDTRMCEYTFTLTKYTSMSYACRNCPFNKDDCFRKDCVSAGGFIRPITVANHMMPGPGIHVCEGDRIQVTVINSFNSEATTIHWHGIHQVGSPFMDGTPFLTQCPIPPHNSFKYDFVASPPGTHIWHSHMGFQEADGLYGNLIVRKPDDPLSVHYDYDLAEHAMIIWHWYPMLTATRLVTALQKRSTVEGHSLLINGLAAIADFSKNGTTYKTPREVFEVESGKKYRFRTIFNSAVYCPVQVSVDDHTLVMIASDSGTFEPLEVDSFIINSGERFDFVLNADKPSGNYWIRYRGLGDCQIHGVEVSEVAVLRYKDAKDEEPQSTTNYDDAKRPGKVLNPVQMAANILPDNTVVKLTELKSTSIRPDVSGTPNHTYYFKFSFNTYESHFAPGAYPQINDISFEYPPFPLLTEGDALTRDMYCTESDFGAKTCADGLCSCPLVYRVQKDSLVEIVFIDTSTNREQDHPMHFHGYDFRVVAMETLGSNATLEFVKTANEAGQIVKTFDKAPVKDTVGVPDKGFTIVRFIASNPGYWFFHCHVSNHAEMGMGFAIKVGEDNEMIQPTSAFPKCGPQNVQKCA